VIKGEYKNYEGSSPSHKQIDWILLSSINLEFINRIVLELHNNAKIF